MWLGERRKRVGEKCGRLSEVRDKVTCQYASSNISDDFNAQTAGSGRRRRSVVCVDDAISRRCAIVLEKRHKLERSARLLLPHWRGN